MSEMNSATLFFESVDDIFPLRVKHKPILACGKYAEVQCKVPTQYPVIEIHSFFLGRGTGGSLT